MSGLLLHAIPLTTLSGVGNSLAERLAKIGLYTLQDLLFHLPLRYEDRTCTYNINQLYPGITTTVQGKIIACEITTGRRRMLLCHLTDHTGKITLRFFNFNAGMKNSLIPGKQIFTYGELKRGAFGLEMMHPEYRFTPFESDTQTASLTPVYPTTEGLRQSTLRTLIEQALNVLLTCSIPELSSAPFPADLPSLKEALLILHRPEVKNDQQQLEAREHPAQRRLILEEFAAHYLSMLKIKTTLKHYTAYSIPTDVSLQNQFLASLPFKPTQAQHQVVLEISQDLARHYPMMRLVQGDVGSGKTLVAALTALNIINQHKQVALMAPTELLAEQHANTFRQWFEPLGITIGWLSGKQKGKARSEQLAKIASGKAKMVIGTHALFQEDVAFANLALIIIDEQHRFGVHQRLMLWEKGKHQTYYPHQLIMTATPIPRTLAMTAYANLNTSIINELPPGRTPITTIVIPDSRRNEVISRVNDVCLHQQRQAYWVCTLIEESALLEAQAAEATFAELQETLPDLNIGLVHGRMNSKQKNTVMEAFKQGSLHLLVATTVIEVGVDVPNASLMIIENPERLGLAQLHQLRGRVGRGAIDSHCVLLYKKPLSNIAQQRLQVLKESQDGFFIAQKDLEIRGPGEVLGTRQTGSINFKIADLLRDQALIPEAQHIAKLIYQQSPEYAEQLVQRWLTSPDLYAHA